jgi:hypothetical protein
MSNCRMLLGVKPSKPPGQGPWTMLGQRALDCRLGSHSRARHDACVAKFFNVVQPLLRTVGFVGLSLDRSNLIASINSSLYILVRRFRIPSFIESPLFRLSLSHLIVSCCLNRVRGATHEHFKE